MKILVLADKESPYLWDYFEKSKFEGIDLIISCGDLAADYLSWSSGKLFDSEVCYVFIKRLSEYFVGKTVKLSNGEEGKIIFVDTNFPTRPVVQVGDKFIDLIKDRSINVEVLL